MNRFLEDDIDLKTVSPLSLAFVGDGVYELFVRELLLCQANCPSGALHKKAVQMVKAPAQARAANTVLPLLTEEELNIFKRGRNAHTARTPKGATVSEYHAATAIEALFGYLYLSGQLPRLKELFLIICAQENPAG